MAYFYLRTLSPERALDDGELDVAAGTAWLWARAVLADILDDRATMPGFVADVSRSDLASLSAPVRPGLRLSGAHDQERGE